MKQKNDEGKTNCFSKRLFSPRMQKYIKNVRLQTNVWSESEQCYTNR